MNDAISQLERVQPLVERGPLAFTAALFAVAFLLMLLWHLRTVAAHYREGQALLQQVTTTLHSYLDMMSDVRFLAMEGREKREARLYQLREKRERRGDTRTDLIALAPANPPSPKGGK